MTSLTRQLLSHQAPLIIHELRAAFERNETALLDLAAQQRGLLHGNMPATLRVPFHFDEMQVAYAAEDEQGNTPSFSITIFLTR